MSTPTTDLHHQTPTTPIDPPDTHHTPLPPLQRDPLQTITKRTQHHPKTPTPRHITHIRPRPAATKTQQHEHQPRMRSTTRHIGPRQTPYTNTHDATTGDIFLAPTGTAATATTITGTGGRTAINAKRPDTSQHNPPRTASFGQTVNGNATSVPYSTTKPPNTAPNAAPTGDSPPHTDPTLQTIPPHLHRTSHPHQSEHIP